MLLPSNPTQLASLVCDKQSLLTFQCGSFSTFSLASYMCPSLYKVAVSFLFFSLSLAFAHNEQSFPDKKRWYWRKSCIPNASCGIFNGCTGNAHMAFRWTYNSCPVGGTW